MMSFVSVSNLHRKYGTIEAVKDFSFEVERGEIFALVGPDGAGKTTIIRTLCGLITPDSGSAVIDGMNVATQFSRIKLILGYMPQVFSLYGDLTVEENLTFYGGIFGITGEAFLKKAEYLYRFSKLKPFANRRAQALSGGMKQKLALSCALMHDPQLLVLDEPTTGVDPLSRRQFWEILLELKQQGVTIIVSTPYMDEVARADRACFVFGGNKLAEGRPEELPSMFDGALYYLDIPPTASLLEQFSGIENLQANRFGAGIHVFVAKGSRLEDFSVLLERTGIAPDAFKPIEPGLEDCFIQLMERS